MAYQMQYYYQMVKVEKIKKISKYQYFLVVLLLAFGAISVHFGSNMIEMVLLGEIDTVETAVTHMVEKLQDGVVFQDAIAAFCDEITE